MTSGNDRFQSVMSYFGHLLASRNHQLRLWKSKMVKSQCLERTLVGVSQALARARYRFTRNDNVGANDAGDDTAYLLRTFVDTGDLAILRDMLDPRAIVVGRTGSGKSALLLMLKTYEERVTDLDLDRLALTFVANDNILNFLSEGGVDLDLFYKLIWQHVFVIELIQARFGIRSPDDVGGLMQTLRDRMARRRGKARARALDYLERFKDTLWVDTEEKVREITTQKVNELRAGLKAQMTDPMALAAIEGGVSASRVLGETVRQEILKRGQSIVNKAQMAELAHLEELLNEELLDDSQKHYFITIDRLDEAWIGELHRYPMIAALLDTAKTFNNRISTAKVIVALREDLIDRVFRYVKRPGYQVEKFDSLKVDLRWSPEALESLLDERFRVLLESQARPEIMTVREGLPKHLGARKQDGVTYLLDRTMLRPRDAIAFLNACIAASAGSTAITAPAVAAAEEAYSTKRLEALRDEWRLDYPSLADMILCLKRLPEAFTGHEVLDQVYESVFDYLARPLEDDGLRDRARAELEARFNEEDREAVFLALAKVLHRVGALGVKAIETMPLKWAYDGGRVRRLEVEHRYRIHPSLWRVLGTRLDLR